MRYAGGGVGHYRVTLSDTPANANQSPQDDFAMDDDVDYPRSIFTTTNLEECGRVAAETAGHEDVREAEHILDDHIDDRHSDSETEDSEEDEENLDEDHLGAEDGEGGCLDAEDEEGYAAL